MTNDADTTVFSALHVLEYPYTRSVGPVVGHFLGALREKKIEGIRAKDGRVIVPPVEYDPETGDELSEWVDVGTSGVVTTWSWVHAPRAKHPLDRPFAWALIKLDGADTALLHAVDTGDESKMSTGMRVAVKWRDQTEGHISDIVCFVPENAS